MKKILLISILLGVYADVHAGIVLTLGEFSSPMLNPGTYYVDYHVGDFSFALTGLDIVSATISGHWGTYHPPYSTTAHNELWMDDILIANTLAYSPDPSHASYVSWSYTFDPSEYYIFEDNLVAFHTIQTRQYNVRLGVTTLTLQTVPEPGTVALLAVGAMMLKKK